MDQIRVAFIGAGALANNVHYPTLARMEDVAIVAVADLDPARLAKTADTYRIPGRYADYRQMFARERIDAVYAILPPQPLKAIALDVIRAGKHLFLEKPAGMNSRETRELAAAARAAGIRSAVGCNRRYCPVLRRAHELVRERGPVSMMMGEFHKRMTEEMFGISMLHADILHVIDPMRAFLGEAVEVHAHADHWYGRAGWAHSYNAFQALIRFDSGASAVLSANRRCGTRYERFELHGNGISAVVRAPDVAEIWRDGQPQPEVITAKQLTGCEHMRDTYGYWTENREFIDAIRAGRDPATNLEDNARTMELCDRIDAGTHVAGGEAAAARA
jgi:predicted dehydrogenase